MDFINKVFSFLSSCFSLNLGKSAESSDFL